MRSLLARSRWKKGIWKLRGKHFGGEIVSWLYSEKVWAFEERRSELKRPSYMICNFYLHKCLFKCVILQYNCDLLIFAAVCLGRHRKNSLSLSFSSVAGLWSTRWSRWCSQFPTWHQWHICEFKIFNLFKSWK